MEIARDMKPSLFDVLHRKHSIHHHETYLPPQTPLTTPYRCLSKAYLYMIKDFISSVMSRASSIRKPDTKRRASTAFTINDEFAMSPPKTQKVEDEPVSSHDKKIESLFAQYNAIKAFDPVKAYSEAFMKVFQIRDDPSNPNKGNENDSIKGLELAGDEGGGSAAEAFSISNKNVRAPELVDEIIIIHTQQLTEIIGYINKPLPPAPHLRTKESLKLGQEEREKVLNAARIGISETEASIETLKAKMAREGRQPSPTGSNFKDVDEWLQGWKGILWAGLCAKRERQVVGRGEMKDINSWAASAGYGNDDKEKFFAGLPPPPKPHAAHPPTPFKRG